MGDERGGGGGGASGSFGTSGYDEALYWSSQREEEERLKANVKLSPSFDVAALFPQPHPQVREGGRQSDCCSFCVFIFFFFRYYHMN